MSSQAAAKNNKTAFYYLVEKAAFLGYYSNEEK